jgi:hypothetical protein
LTTPPRQNLVEAQFAVLIAAQIKMVGKQLITQTSTHNEVSWFLKASIFLYHVDNDAQLRASRPETLPAKNSKILAIGLPDCSL